MPLNRTFMRGNRAHNLESVGFIHRNIRRNGILSRVVREVIMRIAGLVLIVIGFIDVACHWIFQINIYDRLSLNMPDWLYPYSPALLFVLGTAMVTTYDKNKKADKSK